MKLLALAPLAVALATADAGPSPTVSPEEVARRARVAVQVGEQKLTVGELENRIASLPPYQAETYGATREEIVRAWVDQVVVRDLVLGEGARKGGLERVPLTHDRLLRARSDATLRALRQQATARTAADIPAADVAAWYEANKVRFDTPERINVWRILCATADEARTVAAAAKADLSIPKYQDLARDHSVDRATKYRGGNLGFLAPDGASSEAGLKVDPAIVKAAVAMKDGDLSTEPVAEGSGFAVLWRRTTVPATHRALADVEPQIRATLFRERTERAEKKLIDELRAKHLKDYDAEPLKIIELPALDAGINLPRSVPSARR